MALAETLEIVKRREDAARWDAGESEVLAKLAAELPQQPELNDQTRADLQPFLNWTTQANVRYCPAKPFVVAAYVIDQATTGASTETLLRRVNAISALHDRYNLADPVSTAAARYALATAIPSEPPRSWNKAEKAAFVGLPPEVKAAIQRRDHQREVELRRMQNQVAELKRQTTAADTKEPVEIKEETKMAKREGYKDGIGPYSGQDDIKFDRQSGNGGDSKDISRVVDSNWNKNDGFAAPVKPARE
jgi:hypothetical protein